MFSVQKLYKIIKKLELCAGGGSFEVSQITLTPGQYFGSGDDVGDMVLVQMNALKDSTGQMVPEEGSAQGAHELQKAGASPAKQEA